MNCHVVVVCTEGLMVTGEIGEAARSVLDGPISEDRWLVVYNTTCSRPGRDETQAKEVYLSMKHVVSWRDAEPSGQEALDVGPEPAGSVTGA